MKSKTVIDQMVLSGRSNWPGEKLLRRLEGIGQMFFGFLSNLDFAIQLRLALWAIKRRRRQGERPRVV